jgi:hypothetical protein
MLLMKNKPMACLVSGVEEIEIDISIVISPFSNYPRKNLIEVVSWWTRWDSPPRFARQAALGRKLHSRSFLFLRVALAFSHTSSPQYSAPKYLTFSSHLQKSFRSFSHNKTPLRGLSDAKMVDQVGLEPTT